MTTSTDCGRCFCAASFLVHTFEEVPAGVGVDCADDPPSRDGRSLDLDRHRGACPAAARPAPGRGPAPTLGATAASGPADPGPGPSRVSVHLPDDAHSGRCAETLPARSRTTLRLEEHPSRSVFPRGQTRQNRHAGTGRCKPHRSKIKLREWRSRLLGLTVSRAKTIRWCSNYSISAQQPRRTK